MQNFETYLENTFFNNPANDIDQYITGLYNRLALLPPDQLEMRKEKLVELKNLIDYTLKGHGNH